MLKMLSTFGYLTWGWPLTGGHTRADAGVLSSREHSRAVRRHARRLHRGKHSPRAARIYQELVLF
jgi:hypothetical protein